MPRKIVTTDPSTRPSAPEMAAGASGADQRRERQIRRPERLSHRRGAVGTSPGTPTVRRPDGQALQLQRNGQVATITRVKRVQSYLHLHG